MGHHQAKRETVAGHVGRLSGAAENASVGCDPANVCLEEPHAVMASMAFRSTTGNRPQAALCGEWHLSLIPA